MYGLRDLEDLEAISRLAGPGRRAVVLGGGNVGLQVCEAFLARGMEVTVVAASPHLLSQMVDAEAGRRVAELFGSRRLNVRTGRDAVEIDGQRAMWKRVRLDNGEWIAADVVVVAKGIAPNVEWLRGSGVRIGRGITVDLSGRTNVAGVFAAGDCAEAADPLTGRPSVSGIWPVAYEMGRAAGSAAVGIERPSGRGAAHERLAVFRRCRSFRSEKCVPSAWKALPNEVLVEPGRRLPQARVIIKTAWQGPCCTAI